jgi:hypothetical protein
VHPFSDAGQLAEELPHGRLLQADSLVELRLSPQRLTDEIAAFLDEVWAAPRRRRTGTRTASARKASPSRRRGAAQRGRAGAPADEAASDEAATSRAETERAR